MLYYAVSLTENPIKVIGMSFRILSANLSAGSRKVEIGNLVDGYSNLIAACAPDLLLMQEAARELPVRGWAGAVMRNLGSGVVGDQRDLLGQLAGRGEEYQFFFAPAIQSNRDSHPEKWQSLGVALEKVRAQGCALAVRKERVTLLDFWTGQPNPFAEPIELTLPSADEESISIYSGTRDSEPRIAQGLRLLCDGRDWVVWNVHGITISNEREGYPTVDAEAVSLRARQLKFLVRSYEQCRNVHRDARWVIGGDFNASPRELESQRDISGIFANAFLGPSRPNGSQVDTILLEAKYFPHIGEERSSKTKILITSKYAAVLPPAPNPPGGQLSAMETGWGKYIEELLDQGVDHFPLLLEL